MQNQNLGAARPAQISILHLLFYLLYASLCIFYGFYVYFYVFLLNCMGNPISRVNYSVNRSLAWRILRAVTRRHGALHGRATLVVQNANPSIGLLRLTEKLTREIGFPSKYGKNKKKRFSIGKHRKKRKIKISKIVDTSGPKDRGFSFSNIS